jgi:NitT/TauT family transport system substrate-binding protein
MCLERFDESMSISRSQSLALLAAGAMGMPRAAVAQSTVQTARIRVGAVPVDSYAEPLFANDLGFFDRAGLAVEILPFNSGGPMAAAAAGGAIDIGMTDVAVLANAVARGLPFVAIAGSGLYSSVLPTTVLCVAKSSPFRTAVSFEGHAIAVSSLASLSSTGVSAWLSRNGADITKVRLVEMPPPEMSAALNRNSIAGAFIAEPVLSQALPFVEPLANAFDAIGKRFALNNWFTTKDWLQQNGDAAKRLVRAIYDTANWANKHHDETATILTKYAHLDLDQARRMRRATYATSLDVATMQPALDAAFTYKVIDRHVNAADLLAKTGA